MPSAIVHLTYLIILVASLLPHRLDRPPPVRPGSITDGPQSMAPFALQPVESCPVAIAGAYAGAKRLMSRFVTEFNLGQNTVEDEGRIVAERDRHLIGVRLGFSAHINAPFQSSVAVGCRGRDFDSVRGYEQAPCT